MTAWSDFVKDFRQKNPGYSYKDALKRCKDLWIVKNIVEQKLGGTNFEIVDHSKGYKKPTKKKT